MTQHFLKLLSLNLYKNYSLSQTLSTHPQHKKTMEKISPATEATPHPSRSPRCLSTPLYSPYPLSLLSKWMYEKKSCTPAVTPCKK